jgi:erythritol transport system ATP-binding protein
MPARDSEIVLEAKDVLKRYPGNVALDHVTFRVYRNAVNVLIGENGAGKSTLMRILAGVELPDGGTLTLDGERIELRSPRDASAHGISIVHQELAMLPNLDITENIFAGRELVRSMVLVDRASEDSRSVTALGRLRNPMAVATSVSRLSLGRRQVVELARTVAHGAKIVILDEPTSALSTAEADSLFQVIADLKSSGVTIIYISHRLHELLHLGDHFTVLRGGKVVGEAPRAEVDRAWIVERMSGVNHTPELMEGAPQSSEQTLTVRGLSLRAATKDEAAQSPLFDVNFSLHRGEILGVYGLLGSGRTELLEALAGARQSRGTVLLNGRQLSIATVSDAVKAGIVLVPEDRQRDGLIPDLSIRENIALASAKGLFLSRAKETATVRALAGELNLTVRNLELPVTSLSGGNQQKVLLARCLMRSPKVLLLDEPTRGVDVGAKREIYRILRQLAAKGLAILFTSSEIEETRTLADRVLVLCQGNISAEFASAALTDEALFSAASPRMPDTSRPTELHR